MPYEGEPFDPAHPRCRFPAEGERFGQVMQAAGMRPPEIARAVGISVEQVRGYRRGFARPGTVTKQKLERVLGQSLDPQPAKASAAPMSITVPASVTVQRDPSGDFIMSIRVAPDQLSRFLTA